MPRFHSTPIVRLAALLMGAAAFSSTALLAADFDLTGQGGQYQASLPVQLVKGQGGVFAPATAWVPLLIPHDTTNLNPRQPLFTSTVCAFIGGAPVAGVATYHANLNNTASDRVVIVMGTTDADSAVGASADVRLAEISTASANTLAELLPDGRLLLVERFADTQNNIGIMPSFLGPAPVEPAPPIQAPFKVFSTSAVGIGAPDESGINPSTPTVVGAVVLGTPSVTIDPHAPSSDNDEDLLVAITLESFATGLAPEQLPACVTGVGVFRGRDNDPAASGQGLVSSGLAHGVPGPDYVACWRRESAPIPSSPIVGDLFYVRQSQPVIRTVVTPSGAEVVYVVHGIGHTGAIGGGAGRPLYLACDTLRLDFAAGDPIPENNTILIEADAMGPVGTIHGRPMTRQKPSPPGFADHWNSDRRYKFHDQTSSGSLTSSTAAGGSGRFDMNARGEIVAIFIHETGIPFYQIRLFRPMWNAAGTRITGFTLGAVIASSGDVDLNGAPLVTTNMRTSLSNSPSGTPFELPVPPFSGIALDDLGRVTFVAAMEKFQISGNWDFNSATPPTVFLRNVTTGLFVWEPQTESLHLIAKGGQNGQFITDGFPGAGPPADESLSLGVMGFGLDPDAYGPGSFSPTGGLLAVALRSCGNQFVGGVNQELERQPDFTADTFLDRGGVLFAPGMEGIEERSARAVMLVQLGAFIPDEPCCAGNADKAAPGAVSFTDVTAVIANWNGVDPSGAATGDADCSGVVNFDDITTVLSAWGASCP